MKPNGGRWSMSARGGKLTLSRPLLRMHLNVLDALRIELQRITKCAFSLTRLKRKMSGEGRHRGPVHPTVQRGANRLIECFGLARRDPICRTQFDALLATCVNEHGGVMPIRQNTGAESNDLPAERVR